MLNKKMALVSAAVLTLATAGASYAEGLYGTAMLGYNWQKNDSSPYGGNVAVDPDFPQTFNGGDGGVGALGLGFVFNDQFRIEGRLGFHASKFNDGKVGTGARAGQEYVLNGSMKSTSLTVEAFYDFQTSSGITPYVKAGVGVARSKYAARLGGNGVAAFDAFDGTADGYYDGYSDGSSTNFAWNVGFGASYAINDDMSLFGEYQYMQMGDVRTGQDSFTDGFGLDGAVHEVLFGLRVSF